MNDTLRAADQDREDIVSILREHYAQGRLTLEEFEERSTAAYNARTMGELRPLTADLPVSGRPSQTAAWSPARMRWITTAAVLATVALVATMWLAGRAFLALPTWLVVMFAIRLAHTGRRQGGHRTRMR